MARKTLTHPTTGPGHPGFVSLKNDDNVLTPGGWRPKSQVHLIEPGHHVSGEGGILKKIHTQSGKVIREFGGIPIKKSKKPNMPENVFVPDHKKVVSPISAGAVPATNGWVVYAGWTNSSGQAISSFSTRWKVPPVPATSSGQTIFLFNGIQNSGFILQPVLQWGSSFAGGGNYWAIANWYVDGQGGLALHSTLVQVNPGDDLLGVMTLTGKAGTSYSYLSSFAGFATTNLQVNNIEQLTWANETLEVYGVANCSDYPDTNKTAMRAIEIKTEGNTEAIINWQAVNSVTDCGQHCAIVSNASPGGEVDLFYNNKVDYHKFRVTEEEMMTNFILLWILRHGGEWPDWGDPYGQLMITQTIEKLASGIRDEKIRVEIRRMVSKLIVESAKKIAESAL